MRLGSCANYTCVPWPGVAAVRRMLLGGGALCLVAAGRPSQLIPHSMGIKPCAYCDRAVEHHCNFSEASVQPCLPMSACTLHFSSNKAAFSSAARQICGSCRRLNGCAVPWVQAQPAALLPATLPAQVIITQGIEVKTKTQNKKCEKAVKQVSGWGAGGASDWLCCGADGWARALSAPRCMQIKLPLVCGGNTHYQGVFCLPAGAGRDGTHQDAGNTEAVLQLLPVALRRAQHLLLPRAGG